MPGPEAEQQVAVGRLRAVLPAHHVGAHAPERVLGVDHVPPRAVHLAALLVEHLLVAEHPPERRAADEHDRHEELRVEPEPDLLAHLRDPVGREPLLPVGVVGEVGGRQPGCCAGRVAAGLPLPCSSSRASRRGRCRRRARRLRPRPRAAPPRRTTRRRSARGRSTAGAAPRAGRSPRPPARAARPSSRSRSGARRCTGRTAAAARSSGGARCSSRPCCGASRPSACPCSRAPTRRSRSPPAAARARRQRR